MNRTEVETDKRILVVSDDQGTRALLVDALSNGDYQVFATPDVGSAVFQFGLIQPGLAVLDLTSSESQRWETLQRIRELSSVPVIALTARGDYWMLIESLDRGADYAMSRPFSTRELQARVCALFRRVQTAARCVA